MLTCYRFFGQFRLASLLPPRHRLFRLVSPSQTSHSPRKADPYTSFYFCRVFGRRYRSIIRAWDESLDKPLNETSRRFVSPLSYSTTSQVHLC